MTATTPSGPCIVPDCPKAPARLYPGGRFCDDHAPKPKGRQAFTDPAAVLKGAA